MKHYIASFLFFFSMFNCYISFSQSSKPTPIGYWQSYDHHGKARSIVKIDIQKGALLGKSISKESFTEFDSKCNNCKDKDKIILWVLKEKGDKWIDGQILDADSGTIYQCTVSISSDNQTLHLHAYKGLPIFGKTVDWQRADIS